MKDTGQILAEILVEGDLKVHLIGVAGSGMSGIAGLLLSLGHRVSGSDKASTVETARLQSLGLSFHLGHAATNVADADLVIYSSAIRPGNPEYDEALRSKRNMVRRADALAAIMHSKKGIVVCGMHGKTTTSSMCAHVLRVGGLHPSHYVGAEIPILGTNAHWDLEGEYFVAEGDESDGTLALYHSEHAIVLNIEEEHLDYYENLDAIDAVYRQLCDQTRGKIVYCADDEGAVRVCSQRSNVISYGETRAALYRYDDLHAKDFQSSFRVIRGNEPLGALTLNVPGRHNVSNALAVIALATELGVPFAQIAEALAVFRGARRRFEIKHRSERFMIVDDYGHHPSEIRATLATARNTGRRRVLCMFQPHRYSRTLKLKEEFGRSFHDADFVVVADVYPASEAPIVGVTGQTIVDEATRDGHDAIIFEPDRKKIPLEIGRRLEPGDCVITLGAGNIHEAGNILAKDVTLLDEIQNTIGGGVAKLYEPMAKHTTMRIGGPAQFWVEPETEEGFARLVQFATERGIPLMVVGRGSNLLVRDGGIRGIVAHLSRGEFKRIEIRDGQIIAGVGAKQKELAYAARDAQIGGFEWFEGIPGEVGGALRMNAGAMGGETFRQVVSVRYIDSTGAFHMETPDQLDVHYRHCGKLDRNYAISATFVGHPSNSEEIERKLADSMQKRRTSQPKESSAGCIFKNPETCPAGRLIDELGLKGARVGGVKVSEVHGNFIVNDEHGSANDVLTLIDQIKRTALEKRGLTLNTEVQIIGEEKGLHD
ncbi:MAG TPA: UDP-N-acetylmuramate--L-alanine ligase [Chthoniobacteraceae bacterium]|nr:UDP-N-acetylmuramate--L-alanine ligase [Chthoniobacteraceae bacterium]